MQVLLNEKKRKTERKKKSQIPLHVGFQAHVQQRLVTIASDPRGASLNRLDMWFLEPSPD